MDCVVSQPVRSLVQVSAFFGNLRHFRGLVGIPSVSLLRHGANLAPKSQIFVKVSGRKLAISEFLAWRLGSNYRRPVRNLIYQLETLPESDNLYTPVRKKARTEGIRVSQAASRFGDTVVQSLRRWVGDEIAFWG
jgi:hypothetical protein